MAGIYFHIPFCKRLCAYCDFYKSAALQQLGATLQGMHRELELRRRFLPDRQIRTLYFGGGTPSLVAPEELQRLIDRTGELFDLTAVAEITAEANPDDLTPDYLQRLGRTQIGRLSIGIQSFDDAELRLMNRRHTAAQAERAMLDAREAGFENLSADLIFGTPGFGEATLRRTLERMVALRPEHISAYHLTIEEGTALHRRRLRGELAPIPEAESERLYLLVHETLTVAGYDHYEISNYALPGRRARHNAAYWDDTPYLGIGPGAHSFDGRRRCRCIAPVGAYAATAGTDASLEYETLTPNDRCNERIMTALRTAEGIALGPFRRDFGAERCDALLADARPWLEAGVLVSDGLRLRIPPRKWLLSDAVIEALFRL